MKRRGRKPRPIRERLLSRLIIDPGTGCLLWTGQKNHKGYGYIKDGARPVRVHRLMYEMFAGPIPDGLQLDHLCRVRHCANVAHLEAVTSQENIRRSPFVGRAAGIVQRAKTHCPRGHPYDKANTYHYRGTRSCRECNRLRSRKTPVLPVLASARRGDAAAA